VARAQGRVVAVVAGVSRDTVLAQLTARLRAQPPEVGGAPRPDRVHRVQAYLAAREQR